MVIKNVYLASLLTGMGIKVTAELVVDDSNGVKLTFPDISEIGEIAVDVAVDAPDGTYVIANGETPITIVVLSGKVSEIVESVVEASVAATTELDEEVKAVLTAIAAKYTGLETKYTAMEKSYNELKASLKHGSDKSVVTSKADEAPQFKII